MNWSARFSWLTALRARRELPSAEPDNADMGTAFGLDASIEMPAATVPPSSTNLPPAPARTWESRLIRRSGL